MFPSMMTNISVIKLMCMESKDVLWCEEKYQCNIFQLQCISKNQLVQKYYDVPSEIKQRKQSIMYANLAVECFSFSLLIRKQTTIFSLHIIGRRRWQ